jgi:hypothetical protein
VIATVFGIQVTWLSLKLCRVRPPRGSAGSWGQAVTALSGPHAELKFASYSPARVAQLWSSAWKTDRSNASEHLRRSCRVRTLADVETLAACMVEEQWPAIAAAVRDAGIPFLKRHRKLADCKLVRSFSLFGDPIVNLPAGTTTISGHLSHSRKLSFGWRPRS